MKKKWECIIFSSFVTVLTVFKWYSVIMFTTFVQFKFLCSFNLQIIMILVNTNRIKSRNVKKKSYTVFPCSFEKPESKKNLFLLYFSNLKKQEWNLENEFMFFNGSLQPYFLSFTTLRRGCKWQLQWFSIVSFHRGRNSQLKKRFLRAWFNYTQSSHLIPLCFDYLRSITKQIVNSRLQQ